MFQISPLNAWLPTRYVWSTLASTAAWHGRCCVLKGVNLLPSPTPVEDHKSRTWHSIDPTGYPNPSVLCQPPSPMRCRWLDQQSWAQQSWPIPAEASMEDSVPICRRKGAIEQRWAKGFPMDVLIWPLWNGFHLAPFGPFHTGVPSSPREQHFCPVSAMVFWASRWAEGCGETWSPSCVRNEWV